MTHYGTDLAYIQEVAFGGFASDAAMGVVTILRDAGVDSGGVVDLGCGAGVFLAGLAQAGYNVVGFDVSSKLIEYARRRVPSAPFHVVSLYRAELPQCDAVTAIGEVLSYCSDSARDLDTLFGRVYDALRPGGLFLFDLPELGPSWSARRHFEGKDWALMMEVEDHSRHRLLRRKITTFRKIGKAYRQSNRSPRSRAVSSRRSAKKARRQRLRSKDEPNLRQQETPRRKNSLHSKKEGLNNVP